MTVDVLSRMTKVLSFQAKAGIQEVFVLFNISKSENIDSLIIDLRNGKNTNE